MIRRTQLRRALSSGTVAVLLALTGCGEGETPAPAADTAAPVELSSVRVEAAVIEEPITGTGTIAPLQSTDLGPRVDGIIEEILVRVGARVKKGDPLFRTRDTELKLKVEELENEVLLAEAAADEARRDFNRIAALHKKGVASGGALDKARAAHKTAQARLGVAQAKLGQAKQALEDAVVTAPFDGVITARNVHEGTFMATRMGGGGGGGGGPAGVLQIMEIHIVAAIVDVPEIHLDKIGLGTPATVIVDGLNDRFESEVHRINDYIDPVKRTIEVRIGIRNEDYRIKPGSFVRALIHPPARDALALPRAVVLGFQGQHYVFVARDGKAVRVPVQVRQLDAERVEVVAGLAEGDDVLAGPGLRTLAEDDPVLIRPTAGDGAGEAAADATAGMSAATR